MSPETGNIVRCPNCGGRDVRRSKRAGLLDDLMRMLQRTPFRCRSCQHRFFRRVETEGEAEAPETAPGERKQNAAG